MKKRILSIILTLCMVVTMVPIIPITTSAADKCTCLIQCPYEKNECSVCESGGACKGRKKYTNPEGKGIDNGYYLQNILDFKVASQTLYYFYLENDITLSSDLVVPNSPFYAVMVLDLNGHTINGNNKEIGIKVYGSLTIIDTVGTGKITNCQASALTINDGGYVLMQGGTIEKCKARGGVVISSGGTFEMTGGTIKDNRTIGLSSDKPVIMNISVSGDATFIIDGDAKILNDMDESAYNGHSVELSWNSRVENNPRPAMYANGGIIEGRIDNSGIISSKYAGRSTDIRGTINNYGVISSGVFTHEVVNLSSYDETGVINGGSFTGKVTNNGVINGGEFNAEVENIVSRYGEGNIAGGTFNSDVVNQGTISGGTFNGAVDTENGTIEDSAKVSVNFVSENGEAMKTARVLRGQGVTQEDLSSIIDPTQYGYGKLKYTVGNVDYRDDEKFINEVRFTEDETVVKVTLIYPLKYTITCNLNGGKGCETYYYTVNDPEFSLGTPTKDGYTFVGWGGTGLEGTNNMTVTIPTGSVGDRTYTAYYWEKHDLTVSPLLGYTVVYDTQGGSPIEPRKGLSNSSKVLDVDSPTKPGYRFRYWECGGKRLVIADTTVGDLINKADNGVITLKAVWTEKTEVSFNTEAQAYNYDRAGKAFEIKDTTLDGFNVTYRKNGNTVEAPINAGSYDVIVTREEDEYYKAVNVTIPGGLVINPKNVTVKISEISDQIYTGNDIKPAITAFDGINEIPSSEYTVDYADNINAGTATVTVTDKAGGNYTFSQATQTFTIKKKTITPAVTMEDYVYGVDMKYPVISGNDSGALAKVYYSAYDDIATNTAHRVLLDESFNAKTLAAGKYYMMVEVEESQNYTSGISKVITFNVMPDKYEAPAVPTLNGSTVTISEADRGKALEYSLNGGAWIDVPALNNSGFVPTGLLENTGYTLSLRVKASTDGNYTASDAVGCFLVAYNANGGTGTVPSGASASSGNSVTVAAGDQLHLDGYTFSGWNTEADGAGTAYAAGSTVSTGATLYAQWKDSEKPVITGLESNKTYCDDVKFTVTDNEGIASVTANNVGLTATDGKYTLKKGMGTVKVVATDNTGNITEVTVTVNNGHAGGVATCIDLAICDTCGKPYGEVDSTNHNLEKISATDATVTQTGNTEYWHCLDCGKYFADENGTTEIKLDDTVISKLPPEIIEGKGQSITAGDRKELTFKSNAAFGDFIKFELDGATVDAENYTAMQGSTIITLKPDYVATLSIGEHTIGIVSDSGTAAATFTIKAKSTSGSGQTGTGTGTTTPTQEESKPDATDNEATDAEQADDYSADAEHTDSDGKDMKSPETGNSFGHVLLLMLLCAGAVLVIATGAYSKKRKSFSK